MAEPRPSLRESLDDGRTLLGAAVSVPSPRAAELLAAAGFDWVFVDAEHSLLGTETIAACLGALERAGTPAVARPAWNRPELVGRLLDHGAQAVMSPMVASAAAARELVAACRYPPDGHRSWGPSRPSAGPAAENARVLAVPLLETAEALRALEEILEVEGIDVVAVGQSDLALSLGLDPVTERASPPVVRLVEEAIAACTRHGIPVLVSSRGAADAARMRDLGARMIIVASDAALLADGARAALAELGR